jgi:hypothetical protein
MRCDQSPKASKLALQGKSDRNRPEARYQSLVPQVGSATLLEGPILPNSRCHEAPRTEPEGQSVDRQRAKAGKAHRSHAWRNSLKCFGDH